MSEDETQVFQKENRHGVEKDYVRVDLGTQVIECPRYLHNPITERRHDLTKLSDDGYLKPFLAMQYAYNTPDVVDLASSPYLTFDEERWEMTQMDGHIVLTKREPETAFDEMVLDE